MIDIRLTGNITITGHHVVEVPLEGGQPQVLLAMLALDGGRVAFETAADVIWGDELSPHWRGALRGIASKLRGALVRACEAGKPLVLADGIVRLDIPFTSNVARAEGFVAAAQNRSLTMAEVDELVEITIGLHHPFLVHNDSAWADSQRRRIEAVLDRCEHAVLRALRDRGLTNRAIAWAEQVIARDSVDVFTREVLIELHLADGDISAAHRVFAELEAMLATEFSATVNPELRDRIQAPGIRRFDLRTIPVTRHHPDANEPFVGRSDVLATIMQAWNRVCESRRPELCIVRGPAGIGKSRLCDEALTRIDPPHRLWGRARLGVGYSWGPFADALADVFADHPRLAHEATIEFPAITQLLPELGAPEAHPSSRPHDALKSANPDRAPRQAALAVTRQIFADLLHEPTVLVVDDLQWAGPDGIALIESILVDSKGPLLVVAAYRDLPDSFAGTLEDISRRVPVADSVLNPFDLDELAELSQRHRSHVSFTEAQIVSFHTRTGGLPFYACALLRDTRIDITDSPDELSAAPNSVPESVSIWLHNFLHTLDEEKLRVLELVAVFGPDADLAAIESIARQDPVTLADNLDALALAGLVIIDGHGRVRIPHDITALAVWTSIGRARRAMLHRLVGDYLAAVGAPPSTVARQWTFAGPSRHSEALGAHRDAGSLALSQGAWQTALVHFQTVLDQADDPATQITAMIGLGRALIQLREHQRARSTLEEALDLAAHHGLDQKLAEATLLLVGRAGRGAITDDESAQIERLRFAHARLTTAVATQGDTAVATRLLLAQVEIELAIALMFTGSLAERRQLAESALKRVRATPEASPNDLAHVLLGQRSTRVTPAKLDVQIAELDEVLALPHGLLDYSRIISAHVHRHEDLMRLGQREEAAADLVAARTTAEVAHHAYWLWAVEVWEALGALLDGNLTSSEQQFAAAAASRPNVAEAFACHQVNLVGLRLLQHRVDEMIPMLQTATDAYPEIPTWQASLALALAESGEIERAAALLDAFIDSTFDLLPMDTNRLFALGILAHVAATVRSREASGMLWELLLPHRGQLVLINVYGGGGAVWGPMEWALARLAPLVGCNTDEEMGLWGEAVQLARRSTPVLADRITAEAHAARLG